KRAPLLTATAEARIVGPVVFVAGAGYMADVPRAATMRPPVGLRAPLLRQAEHRVDGGRALIYRQGPFAPPGGVSHGAGPPWRAAWGRPASSPPCSTARTARATIMTASGVGPRCSSPGPACSSASTDATGGPSRPAIQPGSPATGPTTS